MSEITDDAREIAKRWYDGVSEMNDIREKHKLASDIMNYATQISDPLIKALERILKHELSDNIPSIDILYQCMDIASKVLSKYNTTQSP